MTPSFFNGYHAPPIIQHNAAAVKLKQPHCIGWCSQSRNAWFWGLHMSYFNIFGPFQVQTSRFEYFPTTGPTEEKIFCDTLPLSGTFTEHTYMTLHWGEEGEEVKLHRLPKTFCSSAQRSTWINLHPPQFGKVTQFSAQFATKKL